ncbi:MAG: hypothetical protein U1E69_16795 [Tabrizicola sp.]|uniref:hypothetical protein n=2 Tax=Tabrizicola sp. TaxID=2005166 RepID=UPI00276FF93B|nr:hypothetical protein [Tabrizicola sp.]MDP3647216.1 hypothetical protein [Paracoccaceae bacterium]MDZ4088449.1 hypothetical protein [Tabrizicola sp.]
MMEGSLIPMAVVAAVFVAGVVALVCWYVATRLGQGWAIALPLVALAGFVLIVWERVDATLDQGLGFVALCAIVASPILLGAALGIGLYRWRRKSAAR